MDMKIVPNSLSDLGSVLNYLKWRVTPKKPVWLDSTAGGKFDDQPTKGSKMRGERAPPTVDEDALNLKGIINPLLTPPPLSGKPVPLYGGYMPMITSPSKTPYQDL